MANGILIQKYQLETLQKYGFPASEQQGWRRKRASHRSDAKAKGVSSHLSFDDYVRLASNAGLTSVYQIGQHAGQYQLGRYTDSGDYTVGTCRFITVQQNQDERKINGGTAVAVEKAAQKRRGQTKHTNEGLKKMADTLTGRSMSDHSYLNVAGLKRGKPFELIDPEGKRHSGVSLYRWCRENGFNQPTMNALLNNPGKSYKGWTGRYLDGDEAERVRNAALAQVTA